MESLRRCDFERRTFKYQAVFPDRTGCSGISVSEVVVLISRNDGFSFLATDTKRHQTSVLQIPIVIPIASLIFHDLRTLDCKNEERKKIR